MKAKVLTESSDISIYKCKKKTWKDEKTKDRLKGEERSDTYLIHVCSLPQSEESLERLAESSCFYPLFLDNVQSMANCRHDQVGVSPF